MLDILQYQVQLDPKIPNTKQSILSAIAKQFDPLGWVTPVTISTKLFMQLLWSFKLNCDNDIPREHAIKWHNIYSHLAALNKIQIRWTQFYQTENATSEIHGFADASSIAYAAAVYLKTTTETGDVTISLLAVKSKVAPLRTLSVPRLELSVVVLLAKLMTFIREDINYSQRCKLLLLDGSTIVLAWLKQHPTK